MSGSGRIVCVSMPREYSKDEGIFVIVSENNGGLDRMRCGKTLKTRRDTEP